jgi:hypothetical protein
MENLERMITLAGEFFKTKNDPDQISINKRSMTRLGKIHPSAMTERRNKKGPIAWMLVIPTTHNLMNKFISKEINEHQLLYKKPLQTTYDALYLCSALVLPEERGKGFAKRLAMNAVKSIKRQHPIKSLFYWAFSVEGKRLAMSIAKACELPLYARKG